MKKYKIVIESPSYIHRILINYYIYLGYSVYVLEPFCAYHHRKIRFYPQPLPKFVNVLLQKGKIQLIHAKELKTENIVMLAAEKAAESVEKFYTVYKVKCPHIITFLIKGLKSEDAEYIFMKNLCDKLGDFYSLKILFRRMRKLFGSEPILFYSDSDLLLYSYLKSYLNDLSGEHLGKNVFFPRSLIISKILYRLYKNILISFKLFVQTLLSFSLSGISRRKRIPKTNYKYAISIVAPDRQLNSNLRGPGFFVDEKKILKKDVVLIPIVELTRKNNEELTKLNFKVFKLPKAGKYFTKPNAWKELLLISMKNLFRNFDGNLEIVASTFFNSLRWRYVLSHIGFNHFITHADYGIPGIARNIILKANNIETWYFTDSTNYGQNYRVDEKHWNKHPFWAYLNYDNLVTWHEDFSEYLAMHPNSFKKRHVVGCLWGQYYPLMDQRDLMDNFFHADHIKSKFIIAAFASTYTVNGITSYEEGIKFAKDLQYIIEEFNNIYLILKDKKNISHHLMFDPVKGFQLINIYKEMKKNVRIKFLTHEIDASLVMGMANMIISFPFTSTSIEALSINKPAIWHDPLGNYVNNPYSKIGGFVTHGYDELKAKISEIMSSKNGLYENPIPSESPFFDPYRDGNAIDRFRDLLIKS